MPCGGDSFFIVCFVSDRSSRIVFSPISFITWKKLEQIFRLLTDVSCCLLNCKGEVSEFFHDFNAFYLAFFSLPNNSCLSSESGEKEFCRVINIVHGDLEPFCRYMFRV